MKRTRLRFASLGIAALCACSHSLPLTVQNALPLQVSIPGENRQYMLSPNSEEYHRLKLWISANQPGWSPYYATTPNGGIIITGTGLWLEFIGSSAITHVAAGTFTKSVDPSDYAFLER